ncbi:MAG: hypothetical protein V1913_01575 [Fibrobacterota bacterium]
MVALKNVEFITDAVGRKKSVLLRMNDFERLQEELEDLEDALAIEKAKREAGGFKKWKDFIKEVEAPGKP